MLLRNNKYIIVKFNFLKSKSLFQIDGYININISNMLVIIIITTSFNYDEFKTFLIYFSFNYLIIGLSV